MSDSGDFLGALLSIGCGIGLYCWGKNKGYQKASFENDIRAQQREIDQLRKELNYIKCTPDELKK